MMLFLATSFFAEAKVDLTLGGGVFYPLDSKVRETFDKNFYLNGNLGLMDDSGAWEVRGNLGHYADISHNPADAGVNFRIDVTPFTASLLYHFGPNSALVQPYVGAGAGAYFYSLNDDQFGNLESGTKFGVNGIAGIKFNISDSVYINTEYNHDFVPKIFFNNSQNFNSSALTIGVGFYFPTVPRHSDRIYSQHEEELLARIQALTVEIKKMKDKRIEIEAEIDHFYERTDLADNSPEFAKALRRVNYLEAKLKRLDAKISEAETQLALLEQQWKTERADNRPVRDHIVIYESYYQPRPYWYRSYAPSYYYYREREYTPPPPSSAPPTTEEKEKYIQKKKERIRELKNR